MATFVEIIDYSNADNSAMVNGYDQIEFYSRKVIHNGKEIATVWEDFYDEIFYVGDDVHTRRNPRNTAESAAWLAVARYVD